MGFLDRLKQAIGIKSTNEDYLRGFAKTNNQFGKRLRFISQTEDIHNDNFLEELMITLIEGDFGYKTAQKVCNTFVKKTNKKNLNSEEVIDLLGEIMLEIYQPESVKAIVENQQGPTVLLLVGVNGSGKTTSAAKLAAKYKAEGKKVLLAAADTFRAGAVEQLATWGEKLSIPVVKGKAEEDPSSVLVEACRYAKEINADILICDTAGRLQNKKNLMAELQKMRRVLSREIVGAPHNCWLVLDGNTGQNGLSQAEIFHEATAVDGIILTKIDGTAKGGIILAIRDILGIPVRFLGLGEKLDDLHEFDPKLYLFSILTDVKNEH